MIAARLVVSCESWLPTQESLAGSNAGEGFATGGLVGSAGSGRWLLGCAESPPTIRAVPARRSAHRPERPDVRALVAQVPCEGAPDRADRERWLLMAAASGPGHPDGRSPSARGGFMVLQDLREPT